MELRQSLGRLSEKFSLGAIADATEALDAILQRIHQELEAICPERCKCLAHATFGGMILEQIICRECGATSEPAVRTNFLLYFQATELIEEGRKQQISLLPLSQSNNNNNNGTPQKAAFPRYAYPNMHRLSWNNNNNNNSGNNSNSSLSSSSSSSSNSVNNLKKSIQFGRLLKSCMMSLGDRSCPSLDDNPIKAKASSKSSKLDESKDDSGPRKTPQPLRPCGGKASVFFFSLESPLALALALSWNESRQSKEDLYLFYSLLSDRIFLDDLFSDDINTGNLHLPPVYRCVPDPSRSTKSSSSSQTNGQMCDIPSRGGPSYIFRGLVAYYGSHYVSFFQVQSSSNKKDGKSDLLEQSEEKLEELYYLFDDQRVRPIGQWNDVVALCLASLYQPVLLLYELEQSIGNENMANKTEKYDPVLVHEALLKAATNSCDASKSIIPLSSSTKKPNCDAKADCLNEVKECVEYSCGVATAKESSCACHSPYDKQSKEVEVPVNMNEYKNDSQPVPPSFPINGDGVKRPDFVRRWSRRAEHYVVCCPVLRHRNGLARTIGLQLGFLGDGTRNGRHYPVAAAFEIDTYTGRPLLNRDTMERIHIGDYLVQLNNVSLYDLCKEEIQGAMVSVCEDVDTVTLTFLSANPSLYFYCEHCGHASKVDADMDDLLSEETQNGQKVPSRPIPILCGFCESVHLAQDYMPKLD
eukprot:scaffold926_cov166-Ochromonas_danica.AAC.7